MGLNEDIPLFMILIDMIKNCLNPSNLDSVYRLESQHLTLFPTAFQEYLN